MDQMASDNTGVTLERIQSILLKEILREVVSGFGRLFLQVNSTEYITVLSCSLLLLRRKNNEKNMFSKRTMSEFRQSVKWFRKQSTYIT